MKHRSLIMTAMLLVLPIAAAVAGAEARPGSDRAESAGVQSARSSIAWAFHVEKDENRNQVHYGVRVDPETCLPISNEPIITEWRMFEKSCQTTEALNKFELEAYGVRQPAINRASSSIGSAFQFQINGAPETDLMLYVYKQGGECHADVTVSAGDGRDRMALDRIEVGVGWMWRINHVSLHGRPTTADPENSEPMCFSLKGEEHCEQFQVDDLGQCADSAENFPLASS